MKHLLAGTGVRVVAVCDVDAAHARAAQEIAGGRAQRYTDYRKLLDRTDLDAVWITTPDHWHALQAVAACRSGRHVYCEKPLAHNVREGRLIVEAARESGRVVQIGLQQRSAPHWQHAVERIRAGQLGKITLVHVWNAWDPSGVRLSTVDNPPDSDPPPGVDYDLWLGPAPKRPFNRARFHRTWYYFWDYSGGMTSGWGVHLFDVVMWAVQPRIRSVAAVGGKFLPQDLRDTPDSFSAIFECDNCTMVYTLNHANCRGPHGDEDHGIEFYGTEGTLQINRAGYRIYPDKHRPAAEPSHVEAARAEREHGLSYHAWNGREHMRNFLECIRTGAPPRCTPEIGHQASIPGHLANIAYRVGRQIRWDGEKETIPGDAEAAALLTRTYRDPYRL